MIHCGMGHLHTVLVIEQIVILFVFKSTALSERQVNCGAQNIGHTSETVLKNIHVG